MRQLLRFAGVIAIALGASVIIFFAALDSVVMPYLVDVDRVRVPKLLGRSISAAEPALRKRDLRIAILDSVYSEAVAPGFIVDQTPKPGEFIKKARRVFVDVSRGQRRFTVPDVRERSLREAQLQIRGRQLRVGGFVYVSSSSIPEGAVISQRPAPGTRQLSGSSVNLEVSSGSPFTRKRVPDLRMLPIEQVEDSLAKYEMSLGTIRNQIDNTQPPGRVLKQNPPAGALEKRHTDVDLVVSITEPASAWFDTLRRERRKARE